MTESLIHLLLSPFWENIHSQWTGGMLLFLSVLMICSQALILARRQSRRMYLASIAFLLLAGILVAPFADSWSPREFQHWLMQSQTLGMLSAVQILWTVITVFGSIKTDVEEKKNRGIGDHFRVSAIGLVSILPAPVLLLFLVGVEQNILMAATGIRPETAGIQAAGVVVIVLTLLFIAAMRFLSKYRLIGFQLLVGCILCMTCALLPALSQGLSQGMGSAVQNSGATIFVFCGMVAIACIGLFWPRKCFQTAREGR